MSHYSTNSDEDPVEFDPAKAKAKRAEDAEKIRQDFVNSQRLPTRAPATQQQQPLPKPNEDER